MPKELILEKPVSSTVEVDLYRIILYNDPVNTFDWVIQCLCEVCDHTVEQAEQCAWIVHTKGKYAVKHGDIHTLRPLAEELGERKLTVAIE